MANFVSGSVSELKKIWGWLTSPAAEKALQEAASFALTAAPIVEQIATLTGASPTFEKVIAAYDKFGVPAVQLAATSNPTQLGNYLLNLATTVLQKNLTPSQGPVAVNLLNTAVQLAVTAYKNGQTTVPAK